MEHATRGNEPASAAGLATTTAWPSGMPAGNSTSCAHDTVPVSPAAMPLFANAPSRSQGSARTSRLPAAASFDTTSTSV